MHGHIYGLIERRGGLCSASPSNRTRYLVIGDLGSRDWINSNAGRKIQKVVALRSERHPVAILTEGHWSRHL